MLDLSMGEIGVIAAIALVVLGPDKLPQVAKTAGSLMGKAQRFVSQVKNDIDKEVELSELKKIQEDAKKMASDLQSSLKNTTDSIEKPNWTIFISNSTTTRRKGSIRRTKTWRNGSLGIRSIWTKWPICTGPFAYGNAVVISVLLKCFSIPCVLFLRGKGTE